MLRLHRAVGLMRVACYLGLLAANSLLAAGYYAVGAAPLGLTHLAMVCALFGLWTTEGKGK